LYLHILVVFLRFSSAKSSSHSW